MAVDIREREVLMGVDCPDVEAALRRGDRVAIVVRHAERPPLEKDDPTFGERLPITRQGQVAADAFGFVLKEFSVGCDCRVHSCRMKRCRMTAQAISAAIDPAGSGGYLLDDILGGASLYFGDVSERMALADRGDYRRSLNEYFENGRQKGFSDLAEATDRFEEYLWNGHPQLSSAPLHVYVTHDINVGCFLAGRKVVTAFDDSSWPHFLDAAVAFFSAEGRVRYGYMRHSDGNYVLSL